MYSATAPQSAIIISMRFAPIVSMLVMSLALNAKTIQGKVVRVSDGDTITILDEGEEGWIVEGRESNSALGV